MMTSQGKAVKPYTLLEFELELNQDVGGASSIKSKFAKVKTLLQVDAYFLNRVMRNPDLCICEQLGCTSVSASMYSGQRLG